MLKQIIILFNLFSFILVTALLPADIKIETKLPENSSFVIDSTYIVEVDITKGPIYGFVKFQQNIPDGYIAQPVETADASFTFADGKIKFIWMAIPETEHVQISYALTATSDSPAEGLIDGKLSYIEDNERKSYDIPSIPIKALSEEPIIEKIPVLASVNRSIKTLGNNEYEVSLTIEQQGIEGFGKLEEYMPEGAEASVISNNKSVFSQVDERSKFVWMSVPKDTEFTVSYKVQSETDIESALSSMEGNFSFLDGDETKTVAVLGGAPWESAAVVASNTEEETPEIIEKYEITEVEEVVAAAEPLVEQVAEPKEVVEEVVEELAPMVKEEIAMVEETPVAEEKEEVMQVIEKEEPEKQIVASKEEKMNIPDPESGVVYKVQLVAAKKLVTDVFLRKAYKYKEQYNVENHEGWVKYTTGDFNVYKGARDKREQLATAGHNFPGPFVTAYNDGNRITVQEALMISNQKWFK